MTGRWAQRVFGKGVSRRSLLKTMGAATVMAATGTLGCIGSDGPVPSSVKTITPTPAPTSTPAPTMAPGSNGLVVAVDSDPVRLVDKAIDAFGGLSGIVKKGDRVLIKANFSFARTPEQGACNHPDVLVRIMQRCAEAGASDVTVMDHTIDNAILCMEKSGLKAALESNGFRIIYPERPDEYEEQDIGGIELKKAGIAKVLNDADVFINVPVIKNHNEDMLLSASMKNLMGVVLDRPALHYSNSIHRCIADLNGFIRPDLNIGDAYRVLKKGGPGGADPDSEIYDAHTLLISKDAVALDSYAATMIDISGWDVPYIVEAYRSGLGEIDLGKVETIKV